MNRLAPGRIAKPVRKGRSTPPATGFAQKTLRKPERLPGNLAMQASVRDRRRVHLPVSRAGDPDERQAESLAGTLLQGRRDGATRDACPVCSKSAVPCPGCAREESRLQAPVGVAPGAGDAPRAPATAGDVGQRLGTGRAIDGTGAVFARQLGIEPGTVRIHTGPSAGEAARALRADAFTLGRDIAFAPGRYQPTLDGGQRLLAHELAHVAQEGAGAERRGISRAGDGEALPQLGDALVATQAFRYRDVHVEPGDSLVAVADPDGDQIDVQFPAPHLQAFETFTIPLGKVRLASSSGTTVPSRNIAITDTPPPGVAAPGLPGHEGPVRYVVVPAGSDVDVEALLASLRSAASGFGRGASMIVAPPVRGALRGSASSRFCASFLDALLPTGARTRFEGQLGKLPGGGYRLERYVGTDVLGRLEPRYRGREGELFRMLEYTRKSTPGITPPQFEDVAPWLDRYGIGSRQLEQVSGLLKRAATEGFESLDEVERALVITVFRAHANEGLVAASPLIGGTNVAGLGEVADIPATIGGRAYQIQIELPAGAPLGEVNEVLGDARLAHLVREGEVLFDPVRGTRITAIRPAPSGALAGTAGVLRYAGPVASALGTGYSGYRIITAEPEERARVIGEEAGGQVGGYLGGAGGAAFCVVAGIATGGWVLLGCAVVGGIGGGLLGTAVGGGIAGELGE